MPNYILIAKDAPNSFEKRIATREAHLDFIKELSKDGKALLGGAILDDAGKMDGSIIFFSMTQEEFEQYKKDEPYIQAGVWGDIKIQEAKYGEFFLENIAKNYAPQELIQGDKN